MNLKVVFKPSDESGFTAFVPSLPGCISEGDTFDDTMKNIKEAINLNFEPVEYDSIFPKNSIIKYFAI